MGFAIMGGGTGFGFLGKIFSGIPGELLLRMSKDASKC